MVLRNKKGWLRIIEIALAAALLFSFFIFISQTQFSGKEVTPEWDREILKTHAQDVFLTLDYKDANNDRRSDLRTYVLSADWTSIGNEIINILPASVDYTLYQYSKGTLAYRAGVSASGIPQEKELVSTTYIIAGDYGNFCLDNHPCSLILVLWFKQ